MLGEENSSLPLIDCLTRKTDLLELADLSWDTMTGDAVLRREIIQRLKTQGIPLTFPSLPLNEPQQWEEQCGPQDAEKYGKFHYEIDDPRLLEYKFIEYQKGDLTERDMLTHLIQAQKTSCIRTYQRIMNRVKPDDWTKTQPNWMVDLTQRNVTSLDFEFGYLLQLQKLLEKFDSHSEVKTLITSAIESTLRQERNQMR